ncbi:MAG: type II CAAX endopeptidase family protein [Acidobacteriota bacterium]
MTRRPSFDDAESAPGRAGASSSGRVVVPIDPVHSLDSKFCEPELPHAGSTDPASPRFAPGEGLAWAALLALVALIIVQNLWFGGPPPEETERSPADHFELVFQAKYLIGAQEIFGDLQDSSPMLESLGVGDDLMIGTLEALAVTPRERLALVPVVAHLGDVERAREMLAGLRADLDLAEEVHGDAEALGALLEVPPRRPEPGQEQRLRTVYGWFGDLALSFAAPSDGDTASPEPLSAARRLTLAVIAGFGVALLLLAAGCLLALVAGAQLLQGRLRSAYARSVTDRGARVPYLEALVVFVFALQILGLLAGVAAALTDSLAPLLLNWLALPAALWPLLRGRSRGEVLAAIGWTRGRGAWREVGAGLIGYLAAMPLLALGLLATAVVARFSQATPHHPIVDWMQGASVFDLLMIYLLATVWAPVAEESLFRGAFFHYVRGRRGALVSGLLVALVFAVIHPQGIVGVPFLVSLAVALALVREWRGSVIAPMTMHCLHNGLAITAMVFLLR